MSPPLLATMLPSANRVVEPVTAALLRGLGVTPIFTRFAKRGATDPFPDRHDTDALPQAAELLADALPAAIVLSAGKGAVIGLSHDRALAEAITRRTGIPAATPALAVPDALRALGGLSRIALIGPHDAAYNARAARGFAEAGIETVAEASLGIADNLAFADVGPEAIAEMARRAAIPGVQAILAWNTNCAAAPLAAAMEAELGLPFLDATSLGVWAGLRAAGISARPGPEWGRLFSLQGDD